MTNSLVAQIDAKSSQLIEKPATEVNEKSQSQTGQLTLIADERLELLLSAYNDQKKVMGYRIQLYSGHKRIDAEQMRLEFMKKYKDKRPELIYQPPNFKIRIGNFRNRLIANQQLELYKIDFPGAFLVKDAIEYEE